MTLLSDNNTALLGDAAVFHKLERPAYVQMCETDFYLEQQMIDYCIEYYDQIAGGSLRNDTLNVQMADKEIWITDS
jgi:hypothetical protein